MDQIQTLLEQLTSSEISLICIFNIGIGYFLGSVFVYLLNYVKVFEGKKRKESRPLNVVEFIVISLNKLRIIFLSYAHNNSLFL